MRKILFYKFENSDYIASKDKAIKQCKRNNITLVKISNKHTTLGIL